MGGPTVLVIGLGDLGSRVLNRLAARPEVGQLIGAGRDDAAGNALAGQAALTADLAGGAGRVGFARVDLADRAVTARLLRRLAPDIIVMAASRVTWWRPLSADPSRAEDLRRLPYGVWLPVHVALVRDLMKAQREGAPGSRVVSLPFPDAVGPALAPLGLAPDLGAGNVSEVAAKLRVLAAAETGLGREQVKVRLVMHHAAERLAFPAFAPLGSGEAPWLAEILAGGRPLTPDIVRDLFRRPYALPAGTGTHDLTAAATVNVVTALLAATPRPIHAPAPHGLPGGYPLRASREEITLDLPAGITREEAIAINTAAARSDGIAGIEADGTILFTDAAAEAAHTNLGLRLDRVAPADTAAVADELLERARR